MATPIPDFDGPAWNHFRTSAPSEKPKLNVAAEFEWRAADVRANLTVARKLVEGFNDLGRQFAETGLGPEGGFTASLYPSDEKPSFDPVRVAVRAAKGGDEIQEVIVAGSGYQLKTERTQSPWSLAEAKFQDCDQLLREFMRGMVANVSNEDLRPQIMASLPQASKKPEAKPAAPRDLEP